MGIARVQAPALSQNAATATTITNTFGSNVTAGNLLVAVCGGGTSVTHTVTSPGATWVKVAEFTETGSPQVFSLHYAANSPGGATTVTCTYSATSPFRGLIIAEYSGAAVSGALDVNTTGLETAATTTPTDNAMVTTADGDLIVSALAFRNATSPISAGAGYTLIAADTSLISDIGAEDRIQSGRGSIAATFTVTGGSVASGIMSVAFRAAAVWVSSGDRRGRWPGPGPNQTGRFSQAKHSTVPGPAAITPPVYTTEGFITYGGSSDTSLAVPVPPSMATDDVAVVKILRETTGTLGTHPALTGWTEQSYQTVTQTDGTKLDQTILWKRATGADSGSYTFTWTGGMSATGTSHRITGCRTAGSPFDTDDDHTAASSDSANAPTTTLTSTQAQVLLFWCFGGYGGGTGTTPPSGFTNQDDHPNMGAATKVQAVAGSTGTLGGAGTSSDKKLAFLGALVPPQPGGTTFPQDFTGASTPAGQIVLQTGKNLLAGASTATGILSRQTQKALAGSSTAAGTLARQTQKLLAGSSTAIGGLSVTKVALRAFSGSVTAAGALVRQAQKVLAGASTPTGGLTRQARKVLAGSSTPTGTLAVLKTVLRAMAGTVTPTGVLARLTNKPLVGSSTATGTLTRQTSKTMAGTSIPTGALAVLKTVLRAMAGSITPTGTLARLTGKPLTGTSTATGILTRQTSKTMAGSSTPAGVLTTLKAFLRAFAGSVTPTGVLVRQARKPLTGTSTPTGTLSRQTSKTMAGSTTATGNLGLLKTILRAMAGTVTPTGMLTRRTNKPGLAGTSTAAGILTRQTSKTMAGTSTAAGVLGVGRLVARAFSGTVTAAGTLTRRTAKTLSGQIAAAGLLELLANLIAAVFGRSVAGVVAAVRGTADTTNPAAGVARILAAPTSAAGDRPAADSHATSDPAVRGKGETL
jgi:hypothetical protein